MYILSGIADSIVLSVILAPVIVPIIIIEIGVIGAIGAIKLFDYYFNGGKTNKSFFKDIVKTFYDKIKE